MAHVVTQKETCGIYKITNIVLNKSYIGQSIHIEKRWKEHQWGKGSADLYADFQKYGIENFTFEILETCSKEELLLREKHWIAFYNTFEDGYNLNDGGDNSRFAVAQTKRAIYCYDLNGNFIAEYESLSEAQRETGISNTNISRAARNGGRTLQFMWSYDKVQQMAKYKRKLGKIPIITKSVAQYSQSGELINTYNSLKEAGEAVGVDSSSISKVCHQERKSAGGFVWKFV